MPCQTPGDPAPQSPIGRRSFLKVAAAGAATVAGGVSPAGAADASPRRLLFTSQGKTGLVAADGSGLRYLDLNVPDQVTWQPGPHFSDGRRVVLLSMEPRRDGPGKPFDEYYTQTPTHLWIYDLQTGALTEICNEQRMAPFMTPMLLLGEERILVQVVRNRVGQMWNMRLDGTDAREMTKPGEGLPYGVSVSPDGRRLAFHLASPQGYQVWTSNTEGAERVRLAAAPGHLYFGTNWSPDGRWVVYVDCQFNNQPAHDWADVCVGRADGSEHRVLTSGQTMWFAATYGDPKTRGGGSNVPGWTRDGAIVYPRRAPGAVVPWQYRTGQSDLDHFNRDFKPELAQGGTQIMRLDPHTRRETPLTDLQTGQWDFRSSQSPDGKLLVFCRAATGQPPAIWVKDLQGGADVRITQGVDERGADHPRWL